MDFKLYKSPVKGKKYTAEFMNGDKIHFGASGYEDFTTHKDPKRMKSYLDRHRKTEDWRNIKTAGALSRWILWNKPNLNKSINDTEQRFNITITRMF